MTPQDQQQQSPIQSVAKETVKEENKIHLLLSYIGNILGLPLCIIPLVTVKDDDFVKWHAKNALVLYIAGFISAILTVVLIGLCGLAALLVVNIMALIKSLNGERWRIPLVSDLAEKF
ncbi:MAG: DUF4870 domain-containing protein [Myxococcaceae bacterium]|nr:DUF4870 domain-containing protein [Myxococcaceae bacterium]